MGRREEAMKEAAFMRGDVGVDGAATKEVKDPEVVERDKARSELLRGRTWLGREFLTWLLFHSEGGDPVGEHAGDPLVVLFSNRIVLRGLHGEVVELAAKGTMAPYSLQVRRALSDGLLVHSARLRFTVGERSWEATIDAEFLDVKSAKLPELLTEADDDRLTERMDLAEQLSAMLDGLVQAFLQVRSSREWRKTVVPAMKAWMSGEEKSSATTLERARRSAG